MRNCNKTGMEMVLSETARGTESVHPRSVRSTVPGPTWETHSHSHVVEPRRIDALLEDAPDERLAHLAPGGDLDPAQTEVESARVLLYTRPCRLAHATYWRLVAQCRQGRRSRRSSRRSSMPRRIRRRCLRPSRAGPAPLQPSCSRDGRRGSLAPLAGAQFRAGRRSAPAGPLD